jgi:hypothetical protein
MEKISNDGATSQTGTLPEGDNSSFTSSARSEESSKGAEDVSAVREEIGKIQADTLAASSGQQTKKLWAKAIRGVNRRPVSICVASCKYAVVRDAAKSLGWKVMVLCYR